MNNDARTYNTIFIRPAPAPALLQTEICRIFLKDYFSLSLNIFNVYK